MPISLLMGLLADAASTPAAASVDAALKTFFDLLLAVWPLWVLLGIVLAAKFAYQVYRRRRLAQSGIDEVDAMDGRTFEEFLGTLFRGLGYRVENTRYRGDYGADLVIAKEGLKTAVQAKRWSKRVGIKAVQEAVASAGYYNCHGALVVANREFTSQARALARANNVELWDRESLAAKLLAVRNQGAVHATEPAPNPNTFEPASVDGGAASAECATCGVVVSAKVRDYCIARPQRFGGAIYCFTHQRGVR